MFISKMLTSVCPRIFRRVTIHINIFCTVVRIEMIFRIISQKSRDIVVWNLPDVTRYVIIKCTRKKHVLKLLPFTSCVCDIDVFIHKILSSKFNINIVNQEQSKITIHKFLERLRIIWLPKHFNTSSHQAIQKVVSK